MTDHQRRVLIVDDNQMDRLKMTRMLEADDHAGACAEEGQKALQMMRDNPVDLVLLDIAMPTMSGFEVLEAMKADRALRHIPVIMISALDEADTQQRCHDMGADDYLSKSSDAATLKSRVAAFLEP